jgi:hypothetical protein
LKKTKTKTKTKIATHRDLWKYGPILTIQKSLTIKWLRWVQAHDGDPFWGVTLYYFPRVCMFECVPTQTLKEFTIFLHIMLEYSLNNILKNKLFHFIL